MSFGDLGARLTYESLSFGLQGSRSASASQFSNELTKGLDQRPTHGSFFCSCRGIRQKKDILVSMRSCIAARG